MAMQKYRVDSWKNEKDGSVTGWSQSLAAIKNCQLESMAGNMRANVFITGEPDTYFSIPAVCSIKGCRVRGYVTNDDNGNIVFRHTYY